MDNTRILREWFLKELESEAAATRRCLERIPENLSKWKPHEKSMEIGLSWLFARGRNP